MAACSNSRPILYIAFSLCLYCLEAHIHFPHYARDLSGLISLT